MVVPLPPTATQSVVEGQLTAARPPAAPSTALSGDQLHDPDAYVPTVVTPLPALSCPTATHSVVEGQLTPYRKPRPFESEITTSSVDQLQAFEAYVPTVVTPLLSLSSPTATQSVAERQFTLSKMLPPVPSLATGLSADQLQAPEAYVPMVVIPEGVASSK
jgi:hypothetical protein